MKFSQITESKVADKEIAMEELFNILNSQASGLILDDLNKMSKNDLIFFIHWLVDNKKLGK